MLSSAKSENVYITTESSRQREEAEEDSLSRNAVDRQRRGVVDGAGEKVDDVTAAN